MKKKKLIVLVALLLVVFLMGGVLIYALHLYSGTGLSLIDEWDAAYDFNGKLLLSEDKSEAMRVKTMGKAEFQTVPLTRVDLTPFGFEGKVFSYYRIDVLPDGGIVTPVNKDGGMVADNRADMSASYNVTETFLYPPEPEMEGFWPVLQPNRLVYTDDEGARHCIHPADGLCYPMFADSIEGVDPYGKDVLAFSERASYAIGMTEKNVAVYHTDPTDDSLRIVDVKNISFKKYKTVTFGGFASDTTAYFITDRGYVALDCVSGEIAPSKLDQKGEYSEPICRVYAQRLDVKKEDRHRAVWSHLLLGTEQKTPELEEYSSFEIFSVSPGGKYVAMHAKGEKEEILISTADRAFSLTSVLKEGTKVEKVDFVYENLIYVTLADAEGKESSCCYKVCF